jgi:hypothetical protein
MPISFSGFGQFSTHIDFSSGTPQFQTNFNGAKKLLPFLVLV